VGMRRSFAFFSLAALSVACRRTEVLGSQNTTPPAGASPPIESASVSTPQRVRHDGVGVALASDDWSMRETEPLIVPDTERRPVTLLLHAICSDPTWTCDWLQYSELAPQWQLCPRAPTSCGGGGYKWTASVTDTRRLLELSLATLKARHAARVRDDTVVLVGLSQGAYAVAAVVHDLATSSAAPSPLKVKGIVLHGAQTHLAATDVHRLGARVALAAGDLDGAAPSMRAQALELRRQGVEARFVSLGPVGHFIPVSSGMAIAELIDWTRQE
jgi:predicted esterase